MFHPAFGRPHRSLVAFTVLALALSACAASSQEPTSSSAVASSAPTASPTPDDCGGFPSKDVELVIPYGAGGGFDTWARLVAPAMQEKLPGDVNVIPINRQGAGGLTGVTEVINAPPDGYTIVITEPGVLATAQIGGTTDTDFSSLLAIGRLTLGPEVVVVAANSKWQTIEDVQADADESDPFLSGSGGVAAINIVGFEVLGIPVIYVQHDSSPEALLSMIRGDTDITIYPLGSVQEGIAGGDLRPLVVIGDPPTEGQPGAAEVAGVPTLDEVTGQAGIGNALAQTRILAAPPETPACAIAILEKALADSYADAAFIAQLEEAGRIPVYGDAALAQGVVDVTFTTLEQYAALLKEGLSE